MGKGLVILVTCIYVVAAANLFWKRDLANGLMLLGYTVANVGLLMRL